MKRYSIFELSVIKRKKSNGVYQYFICKNSIVENKYTEIFTNETFVINDNYFIEPLANYYPVLSLCNYETGKSLCLTKKQLLLDYLEINHVNYILNTDSDLLEQELNNRGIYKKSKIYKNNRNKI